MRVPVRLRFATRLVNHGPAVLVTSAAGGRVNVMAASWLTPFESDPPTIGAVLSSESYTRELIAASGELTLSLPTVHQVDLTWAVGNVSGRECDKLARFGIGTTPASRVAPPLVDGCVGWLECRLASTPVGPDLGDLVLAEVVAAWADDTVWDGKGWCFTGRKRRTIHHVTGDTFLATGTNLRADHAILRARGGTCAPVPTVLRARSSGRSPHRPALRSPPRSKRRRPW